MGGRQQQDSSPTLSIGTTIVVVVVGVLVAGAFAVLCTYVWKRLQLTRLRRINEVLVYGQDVDSFIRDEVNTWSLDKLQQYEQSPRFMVEYPRVQKSVKKRIKQLLKKE